MLKTLSNSTFTVKTNRNNLTIQFLLRCSTVTKSNNENNVDTKRFLEKTDEILQVVNKSNLKQLRKYIEQSYAETIILNRTSNGYYKSLNDLFLKNEISFDILNEFCASIIDHKAQQKKWKKVKVKPEIKTLTMPETIMGIHVGATAITWTLLNSDYKILDWDCILWHEDTPRISSIDLINLIPSVVQKLPLSSCYVIEEFQIGKKLHQIVSRQQQMLIATASCLSLIEKQGTNNSLKSENNIFVLQPLASARFFNLVIGNEVISTEYITKLILNDAKTDKKDLQHIYIDNELKTKYIKKESSLQEQIGWSLLKTLTFMRLLTIFSDNVSYKPSI